MRDTVMSESYFLNYLSEEEARAARLRAKLASGTIRPDRVPSTERRLHGVEFSLFLARYSLGESLDSLRPVFLDLLRDFPRFWTRTSSYVNMVWMMSLAVLLEAGHGLFAPLAARIDETGRHDALLDFFTSFALEGTPALSHHTFTCPKPYSFLSQVMEAPNPVRQTELLREYLTDRWYAGHRPLGLCDVHLSKERLYTGYWSFESAALVKILRMDDAALQALPYYPPDLAHYAAPSENC